MAKVHSQRDELVHRLDELNTLMSSTQAELASAAVTYHEFRDRIAAGSSIAEAFAGLSVPQARQSLGDQLEILERARHETRVAIFALGLAEGLSIGELSRLYGFSRQLASRLAREARDTARLAELRRSGARKRSRQSA